MRDELSDRLVPSLTGRTWSHEEFFWSLVFAGSFGLIGFSPEQQNQMRNAINEAANKLRQSCCAGPDSPKIANAIETATYVYQPKSKNCGQVGPLSFLGIRHRIGISQKALNGGCCSVPSNSLPSTISHEGSHLIRYSEDKAYGMEEKCFGCKDPRR